MKDEPHQRFCSWNDFHLEEICSLITDGKHGDCTDQSGSGYFFLSAKDVRDGNLQYDNPREITCSDFNDTHRRTNLESGDILITNSGTIGRMAVARDNPRTKKTTFQKSVAILKPRKETVHSYFLYYTLLARKREIIELAWGTTQKNLLLGDIRKFIVKIPDLETQYHLLIKLKNLDDKIELNRQMNETLEAMARAIFQSWFVDFDPVRAKAEGRDTGLPPEVAALFPSEIVVVDGREVPKGWGVETLGNVIDLAYGESLKEENRQGGSIPVYGSNGRIGWHDKRLVEGPGIIVGRKGNPGIIHWSATDFFPIDTTFYVVPKKRDFSLYYLYHELQRQDLPSLSADSAVPGLNRNMAYMSSVITPPDAILKRFDEIVKSLDDLIQNNEQQSRTLAHIRDALLPKLMSGGLRIGENV